jgi:hypothetical protein
MLQIFIPVYRWLQPFLDLVPWLLFLNRFPEITLDYLFSYRVPYILNIELAQNERWVLMCI